MAEIDTTMITEVDPATGRVRLDDGSEISARRLRSLGRKSVAEVHIVPSEEDHYCDQSEPITPAVNNQE
ncbi:MAG: hypothetical protein NVS1B7_6930 [Candidatus Saccharimonadales bacterium]